MHHISTGYKELKYRTGIWIDAGNSSTITTSYSDTISNSVAIDLIPNLLNYNYERSITVSSSVSHTINNTKKVYSGYMYALI